MDGSLNTLGTVSMATGPEKEDPHAGIRRCGATQPVYIYWPSSPKMYFFGFSQSGCLGAWAEKWCYSWGMEMFLRIVGCQVWWFGVHPCQWGIQSVFPLYPWMICGSVALVQSSSPLSNLPAAHKLHPGFAQSSYSLQTDLSTLPALSSLQNHPTAGTSPSHWTLRNS